MYIEHKFYNLYEALSSIIQTLGLTEIMTDNKSTGTDPGFQVRGGALKKIALSGGRRENFWGISCEKSRFYAQKIIFFPILGGVRAGCVQPLDPPLEYKHLCKG